MILFKGAVSKLKDETAPNHEKVFPHNLRHLFARVKIRGDTKLENFLLYCPKCKGTVLISADNYTVKYETNPNAKIHSLSTVMTSLFL